MPPLSSAPSGAASVPSHTPRFKARRVWLTLHLWLGLLLGFWLSLIGITGSILVFTEEIDEWLNPSLRRVAAQSEGRTAYKPFEAIRGAADDAVQPGDQSWLVTYPRHDAAAYQFFYFSPRPGDRLEIRHVFVNPYTAQVTGTRLVKAADQYLPRVFIPFVLNLHYNLFLFSTGTVITGVIAILALLSLVSGLYLWWPRRGRFAAALEFKRNAPSVRRVYDIHKTAALLSFVILGALLVSGISMNLPGPFTWAVSLFSDVTSRHDHQSTPVPGGETIPPTDAMAIADADTPGGRFQFIYLPETSEKPYAFCKTGLTSLSRFVDRRCITLDQFSGQILHREDTVSGTSGDAFMAWQWPLHSGQAFGMTGRILVLLAGLALPVIFITGVMRWLQKRRARNLSKLASAKL